MFKKNTLFLILYILTFQLFAQNNSETFRNWKFKTGDDLAWASPKFNDSAWKTIKSGKNYEAQGFDKYDGFSWYRCKFMLSNTLRDRAYLKDSIRILLGKIDDADEVFLNGEKVGQTGFFPKKDAPMVSAKSTNRRYTVASDNPIIRWDAENTLAIRVYDGDGIGGLYEGNCSVDMIEVLDYVQILTDTDEFKAEDDLMTKGVMLQSKLEKLPITGKLQVEMQAKGKIVYKEIFDVYLTDEQMFAKTIKFVKRDNATLFFTFTEKMSGKKLMKKLQTPTINKK